MKLNYKIIAGIVTSLSLAAAGAVYAQQGGYGMGGGMGHGGMGYGMGGAMGGDDVAAVVASRLARLKAELKITEKQEVSWKAFENVAKQQSGSMQAQRSQMHAQMHNPQVDGTRADFTVQRDAMMALREANQASHNAAVKDLYAVLTPEQKAIADQRLNSMGGYRGGHGHWGM
jgi:Spy/CpxP family protein refolding chaperone